MYRSPALDRSVLGVPVLVYRSGAKDVRQNVVRMSLRISPRPYARIALAALIALTAIVFTGAAVRLTGSGLGCPDWPQCYGEIAPPLETHAVIEYGNRILSGFVGLAAIAAALLAWFRRPFRRDLAVLGLLLPLGVVGQAVLGGFTVRYHLAPGFVMGHYALSMVILIAAVALAWRARVVAATGMGAPGMDSSRATRTARAAAGTTTATGDRATTTDRLSVLAVRALLPLGAITIFFGTAATAAGPHAGGSGTGDQINRLRWEGNSTLDWAIHQHGRLATVLGLAAVGVYVLLRRRSANPGVVRSVAVLCLLLGLQGVIGILQYLLELPAEMVWVHVVLATITWIALLWSTAAAGGLDRPGKRARMSGNTASRYQASSNPENHAPASDVLGDRVGA